MNIIGGTTWGIRIITRGTMYGGHIHWVSVPSGTGTTRVDYKVLRASTVSLSPLRKIPSPKQNTETRGTNTKTRPFVWAESGKDEIATNKKGGD